MIYVFLIKYLPENNLLYNLHLEGQKFQGNIAANTRKFAKHKTDCFYLSTLIRGTTESSLMQTELSLINQFWVAHTIFVRIICSLQTKIQKHFQKSKFDVFHLKLKARLWYILISIRRFGCVLRHSSCILWLKRKIVIIPDKPALSLYISHTDFDGATSTAASNE